MPYVYIQEANNLNFPIPFMFKCINTTENKKYWVINNNYILFS